MNTQPILEVDGLEKHYRVGRRGLFGKATMQVLHDVSFSVGRGEVLGLVGESGSGKSTIGRAVLRLIGAQSRRMVFDGRDIAALPASAMAPMRKRMQMVFQDPYASLDPRKRVRAILSEPLDVHGLHRGGARAARLRELMELVALDPQFLDRLPHEFSGGQRQRIGIARALAAEPDFIVADEAVSALDVSIQAQILNLIADLRTKTGISMLFISHDLSVVRFISDRVIVLYLGRVVETGPADAVHFSPRHPYTAALVSAEPSLARKHERIKLTGEIPSPLSPPSGCVFRTRCPYALPDCARAVPALRETEPGRATACIRDDILRSTQ